MLHRKLFILKEQCIYRGGNNMLYDVLVQIGKHEYDSYELEANSISEAWIKGARIAKSPMVLKVTEIHPN